MTTGRLSADDVRAIRASNDNGADLARRYGMSKSTIYYIRKGDLYANVTDTCDGARHRGYAGRLTEDEVRAIRASDKPGKVLALEYDMTAPQISMIRRRKSYAWVPE